jgi:ribosomal protein S18 acetylase RimI-like enzyme
MDIKTTKIMDTEPLFRLTEKDVPTAAAVHMRAFLDDPYTTYILKDIGRRSDQLYSIMALTLRYACRYGEVYATPGMEAVAAWMPPGSEIESNWRMIRVGALPILWILGQTVIRSYMQVEKIAHALRERYTPDSYWYLSQLGVEPHLQGQGYGQQVLSPTLHTIDQQGLPVYLETLNSRAIPFYQKLGFHICEEVILPESGPPLWSMRRDPQK